MSYQGRTQPLSRALHRVAKALGDANALARLHNSTHARLSALLAVESSDARTREFDLLLRFFEAEKARRRTVGSDTGGDRLFLVAVEYEFDDGALTQGHGDAIMVDEASDKMYVVECKLLSSKTESDTFRAERRLASVRAQASKYALRVGSWIAHMHHVDPDCINSLARMSIHPMILTENCNRMQPV